MWPIAAADLQAPPIAPRRDPSEDRSPARAATHRFLGSPRAVALALGALAVLSLLVVTANSWLLGLDHPLSDLARVGAIEGPAHLVSDLGGTELALAVAALLVAVLWRRCRTVAVAIPVMLLTGAVVNVVLKTAIGRARPLDPATGTSLASFPSGHAFQATLLLGALPLAVLIATNRRDLARWMRVAALLGVGAVAASRVVLGAHWPTDVVAGVLVGMVLLETTIHLVERRHRGTPTCGCALVVADRS